MERGTTERVCCLSDGCEGVLKMDDAPTMWQTDSVYNHLFGFSLTDMDTADNGDEDDAAPESVHLCITVVCRSAQELCMCM